MGDNPRHNGSVQCAGTMARFLCGSDGRLQATHVGLHVGGQDMVGLGGASGREQWG